MIKVCNHQLKKQQQCAAQLEQQGAQIAIVTCDVEYAAPATQEFINHGILTMSPCVTTDQMGPQRLWHELQAQAPRYAKILPDIPRVLHQYLSRHGAGNDSETLLKANITPLTELVVQGLNLADGKLPAPAALTSANVALASCVGTENCPASTPATSSGASPSATPTVITRFAASTRTRLTTVFSLSKSRRTSFNSAKTNTRWPVSVFSRSAAAS